MVRFNFGLTDGEAENFIGILSEEASRMREQALHDKDGYADWYKSRADYIDAIIEKVLSGNIRVGNE